MRIYEELFIAKPDAPEEELDQFVEQMRSMITTAGGTVDKIERWGKRRLAYRVDKYREGNYVLVQFSSNPETVKEFERRLRVADVVIKFLTVRIDETLKRLEKRKKHREKRAARKPAMTAPAPGLAAPAPGSAAPLPGITGTVPGHPAPGVPMPGEPAGKES
jgi:small subunit ribosomal protein S6